jgi:hypothetical protein
MGKKIMLTAKEMWCVLLGLTFLLLPLASADAQSAVPNENAQMRGDPLIAAIRAVRARLPQHEGAAGAVGYDNPAMRSDLNSLERVGSQIGTVAVPMASHAEHCTPLTELAA